MQRSDDELLKIIKVNDWNQAHVIARGNMIAEILNGHVTSTLVDDDTKGACVEGTARVPDPCRRADEGRVQEHLVEAVLTMFSRSLVVVSVVGLLSRGCSWRRSSCPTRLARTRPFASAARVMRWSRAASVRLNREGWQDTIAKMVDLGANGSDEELAKVLDYLAEHFKGEAPRPLNLNTATAVELESIVGLLRKESAAWIAHRKASGPCKSLDDFKKVPGVPFKKIDERRDRLGVFLSGCHYVASIRARRPPRARIRSA